MKYASLISPSYNGGFFVLYTNHDLTVMSDRVGMTELKSIIVDNLDEFDSKSVAKALDRVPTQMGSNGKGRHYKMYKSYEFYDENGDLLKPQPNQIIKYRSGNFGYMDSVLIRKTVKFHNENEDYFNECKNVIDELSHNTYQLLEIFAEIEDRKSHKYLIIQFRLKDKIGNE